VGRDDSIRLLGRWQAVGYLYGVGASARNIRGKRQEEAERKQGKTVYSERQANQIVRVLNLPIAIDPEQVNATLSDSVLEVTLLKAETAKQVRVLAKAASA